MSRVVVRRRKNAIPDYYTLESIVPFATFWNLLQPILKNLRPHTLHKNEPDPFADRSWQNYHGLSMSELEECKHRIAQHRTHTMLWGNFHQNLMGSIPGWEALKTGHETGCDVREVAGLCIAEVKNNVNTMNSSSKESVLRKLKRQADAGRKPYLVIVHGRFPSFTDEHGITHMSGREFYAQITGMPTFMDELLAIVDKVFTRPLETAESVSPSHRLD